jgi:hypothetical protein
MPSVVTVGRWQARRTERALPPATEQASSSTPWQCDRFRTAARAGDRAVDDDSFCLQTVVEARFRFGDKGGAGVQTAHERLPRKEASPRTTAHAWYRPIPSAAAVARGGRRSRATRRRCIGIASILHAAVSAPLPATSGAKTAAGRKPSLSPTGPVRPLAATPGLRPQVCAIPRYELAAATVIRPYGRGLG